MITGQEEMSGKLVRCPNCKAAITVPAIENKSSPPESKPAAKKEEPPAPEPKKSTKPAGAKKFKKAKKKKSKTVLIVAVLGAVLFVVGLVVVVALGGGFLWSTAKEISERPVARMTASELTKDWKSNPIAFRAAMDGKVMEITGYVNKVATTIKGEQTYFVMVPDPNESLPPFERQIYFHFTQNEVLAKMKDYPIGSKVTVRADFPAQVENGVPCHLIASDILAPKDAPAKTESAGRKPESAEEPEGTNLKSVQLQRTKGPFMIRGQCELTTYFNFDFRDAENTHYSIELRQKNPSANIHCYVRRDSEDGKKIFELLGKGEIKLLTLECEFVGTEVSVAKVNRLVQGNEASKPSTPVRRFVDDSNKSPEYWLQIIREGEPSLIQRARARLIGLGVAAVPEIRKALRDADPKMRANMASLLGEFGPNASGAVDDLAHALSDQDAPVRAAAAISLGRLGTAAHPALTSLVVACTDGEAAVSAPARVAIRQIGPALDSDVSKLITLWKLPDARKRDRCLATLCELKLDESVATAIFLPLLSDGEKLVRINAIRAIGEIGRPAHAQAFEKLLAMTSDTEPQIRQAAVDSIRKLGPAVAADRKALETGLRSHSPETRLYCIEQFAELGEVGNESAPELIRFVRDDDVKVRAACVRALGRLGKSVPGVREEIVNACRDKEVSVRQLALESLGRFGHDPAVVSALFDALKDDAKECRDSAAKSLTSLQPPLGREELPLLCAALKSEQLEVRRFAAAQFARLGTDAATSLQDLMAVANDRDFQVRKFVFAALAAHESKAAGASTIVLDTLGQIVDSDAKQEGSVELFAQGAATLAKIGDMPKAMPILTKGLKSQNMGIRKEAIVALGLVGDPARGMIKEICSLLVDAELVPAISGTLLKLRGNDVVKALCDVAEFNRSTPARVAAIEILGKMGTDAKSAYQILFGISNRNKGKDVGKAAAEALKLIQ
jgi:HEAT repeat protein